MTNNRTIAAKFISEGKKRALALDIQRRSIDIDTLMSSLNSIETYTGSYTITVSCPKPNFVIESAIDHNCYIDIRTLDPHSSYYIPHYFYVFGSNRPMVTSCVHIQKCKVRKNVRLKATHTNRKFYR